MDIEAVPFADHLARLRWRQGEHATLFGPTGSGKTTLTAALSEKRRFGLMLVTKPRYGKQIRDNTLRSDFPEFEILNSFDDIRPFHERVMIWPEHDPNDMAATIARQRQVFKRALNRAIRTGNWAVYVDELHWMSEPAFVGLGKEIAALYHMGRSEGISMVGSSQRPAFVPKIIYSSSSHLYIARTTDAEDLKRLSSSGLGNAKEIARAVSELPTKHDFLYINPTGKAAPQIVNTRR